MPSTHDVRRGVDHHALLAAAHREARDARVVGVVEVQRVTVVVAAVEHGVPGAAQGDRGCGGTRDGEREVPGVPARREPDQVAGLRGGERGRELIGGGDVGARAVAAHHGAGRPRAARHPGRRAGWRTPFGHTPW